MGYVHSIKAEYENHEYLIRNEYTGEETRSRVSPQLLHLFEDKSIFERWPKACPLFRYDDAEKKGYCTVYPTWPEICREFSCWRLLILDAFGKRSGRVMTGTYLACEDTLLRQVWDYHIREMEAADDEDWLRKVTKILTRLGYTVIR
jgi:hypothetical protein